MPTASYAYLLGMYLGDGYLTRFPRDVWALRIFQDARYVDLVQDTVQAIEAILPNRASLIKQPGMIVIAAYSKHWIHLFPQHGPGYKYLRKIALEPWQRPFVDDCPEAFLRGLIHSDGSRSMNTIHFNGRISTRTYSYPRYFFTNASADIRRLFTDSCDALGIHWTQTNPRNIAVSRRADVEFLDSFVGPKS